MRDIFHVDVDAFFASVEQVLRPELKGKPVIVGGDPGDRGVVAAASYEARRYGVHSAMPMSQARRLCPDGVYVRGNFESYGEYSDRIRTVLQRFSPVVERTSLDDFYMDFTGCRPLHGLPFDAAERMKLAVWDETGLSISIGIAQNRMLAKIGSDLAKPSGILEVWRGFEEALLRRLPVERLPGVGPSTAELLHKYGLTEVGHIAAMPDGNMEQLLGSGGAALWVYAHGRDDTPISAESEPPKSIGRETTFREDTADREALRAMLYSLIEHAARQLREEGFLARRVTVKVRYADFTLATAARTLPAPADFDHAFFEAACERLDHLLERKRLRVRLVGVSLSGLTPFSQRQAGLFADREHGRRKGFYRGLDQIRERFGFDIARVGPSLRLPAEKEDLEGPPREARDVRKKLP